MDLHTGIPIWRADGATPVRYPKFAGDAKCEVVVIGGGITGALVGLMLAQAGVETLLVDKDIPGEGSTLCSTGLLQYEVDTPLVDLIDVVGAEHAVHAYRRGLKAIEEIEGLVEQVGDDCGFSHRGSLYFASTENDLRPLEREYQCRKHYGFDVQWLSHEKLADISTIAAPAAIWSRGDAQINPYRLTQQLLKKAQQAGLRIFGKTRVERVDEVDQGVTLTLNNALLRARAVVFATGYQAHQQLPTSPGDLQSTFAMASQPMTDLEGWPESCLIWETARPYFYARRMEDGRAIIGGEDTEYSDDHADEALLRHKADQLQKRFAELFPKLSFVPSHVWGGTFAETKDGLAYIGNLPKSTNIYAALGYGGNGITFSAIASRLIVDLFLRRPNADAPVFSFDR